jgi:cytidine deaminase
MVDRETLLQAAREAAEHAYAPYSRFRVGAAVVVRTPGGPRIVTGANVENGSYGLTLCAERAALAATRMVDDGGEPGPIEQVAVACIDAEPGSPPPALSPCGACRQWFADLAPDAVYYVDGIEQELRLGDLLPLAFRMER